MNLQGVAAIIHNVGIHESWNHTFAQQGLDKVLCQNRGWFRRRILPPSHILSPC
jgi:hypothetical protein